jgi:pyruvate-formate lyase
VVNAETLREAQQRPQDFAGLVVRVAGYSAFFVELSKEIQDDIIRRTASAVTWSRRAPTGRAFSISSATR